MNSPELSTSIPSASEQFWPPNQSSQKSLRRRLMGWLGLNSFGGKLFWLVTLSTLTGLGGMAFFFSEILKEQAEEQVSSSLDGKVNAIAAVTETAETLAYGLGVSATTLHERQAQYPDTYRELVLQLFERRPEFVVGLGLGQSKNGLIVDQPWLFPYYSAITSQDDTSFEQDATRYEDFADDVGEFYPKSQRYQTYFIPQTSLWTEPYQGGNTNSLLMTYYLPMFGKEGDWLGTILVDIDSTHLNNLLDGSVFRQDGHFILLTQTGAVIANPTYPENQLLSYQDIPELNTLWEQVDFDGKGFLQGATGYWAYANVPGQDWLLLGFIPYTTVYDRIFVITVVTTAAVMGVLTMILLLSIQKLNRRLKPILLQCKQLPKTKTDLLSDWHQLDELDQLSLSFFKILEQLNENDETIQRYKQALEEEVRYANQVIEQFLEFTTRIDHDAREQQMLMQQAQKLISHENYQSVDLQLDALSTMGRALDGDLKRLQADVDSSQIFEAIEKCLGTLMVAIDNAGVTDKPQLQTLINRLAINVANLKSYDQQLPSFKKLQYQTSNIVQAGQAALGSSRAMVSVVHSIVETLVKVEAIASAVNGQVKFASDMMSTDLEQRQGKKSAKKVPRIYGIDRVT
ncbi:MAG: Cache domain-containing protein [Leptolyngbya sp. SIO3F4]|nr:Cache domain-containing protein [Leptolyngbya sp. SIO3F4]